jgi:hypothetical protein
MIFLGVLSRNGMFNEEDICQHSKDMATNREKKRGKGG